MSAVAAGVACAGPSGHLQRHWIVDAERRLKWRDPDWMAPPSDAIKNLLAVPIPGAYPVVACEAWRARVLLADGAAYALDLNNPRQPRWLSLTEECDMVANAKAPPLYVAGGTGCGYVWVADSDRRLWTWTPGGRGAIGGKPAPGSGRIVAVDATRPTVILDTGESFIWGATSWMQLPAFGATSGTVRVVGIGQWGITTTAGNLNPGEALDLPVAEALQLIRKGRCELVVP